MKWEDYKKWCPRKRLRQNLNQLSQVTCSTFQSCHRLRNGRGKQILQGSGKRQGLILSQRKLTIWRKMILYLFGVRNGLFIGERSGNVFGNHEVWLCLKHIVFWLFSFLNGHKGMVENVYFFFFIVIFKSSSPWRDNDINWTTEEGRSILIFAL